MVAKGALSRLYPGRTHDLVVVIPGIMGSELYDTDRGKTLWGASLPLLLRSWVDGAPLRHLALDERETDGEYGRVRPVGLLKLPEYLPFLRGAEPYTTLVNAVRDCVVDPRAVVEFAYDWRLPVRHNATLLADTVLARLERWRATAEHEAARRAHPAGRPAAVAVVAHSMGGLLARELTCAPGMSDLVRTVITLGTPFHGSPKAAALLGNGEFRTRRGARVLPARRPLMSAARRDADHGVRALAATLPGLYDLLPRYRCVDDGADGRRLTTADVVALGGDPAQAQAWGDRHAAEPGTLDGGIHRLVVGGAQPTAQSLSLSSGVVTLLHHELRAGRPDRFGDGTVPTGSGEIRGRVPVRFDQTHQGLTKADAVLRDVVQTLREFDPEQLGPPQGATEGVGLDVPDTPVPVGEEWTATLRGVRRRTRVAATITEVTGAGRRLPCTVEIRDGAVQVLVNAPSSGLYRLEVTAGGGRLSHLVLALDGGDADE
ncbi:PGAP1-like alpha/beta domain-containing protein [Phytohabitans houttuyneae]|uniref:GPI inositol-deacylase PGAP1-like alpha/beta domain-containing protein n=1 Tax=Phytohabitans houttuyneae TaxID=1076126 RepID=A0A6V8KKD2_9ACTN|nr:hypothetical protein [Phytohabitans houttuyneae]GFJ82217.1 hypothetical protein Phou_063970 [Phytohabitans houttuyneae]